MNQKANQIDMLHGPLLGKIIKFAIPFAASSILQQLFNTVDVAVVGRFANSEALAAVGANTFIINLMINLFIGISIGANVILANHIGQHDDTKIKHAISTTYSLALISGTILLALGLLLSDPILKAMGTPRNIIHAATTYLRIYFLSAPFFMTYNFGAAILRSKGDTRRPLYILLAAGVLNTILNLILVIVFKMNVAGVAIATGIANAFSAAAIIWLLLHENGAFRLHPSQPKIYTTELKHILKIGIPAGLQGMVFSFSNVFVQTAINSYGSAAIAGASISQTFDSYCYYLMLAFSGAAVTFTGQNYGAAKYDRCKHIFWICFINGALVCFIANMLFITFADSVLNLFTTDGNVIKYAKLRMDYVLIFQSIAACYDIPASSMRGFGYSLTPALLTIIGTCLLRLTWITFICPIWPGFEHLMLCYPISWCLTSILVGCTYISKWHQSLC
jgi:putative MATE family efflux protein